jgi:L-ascorbate metabolism protein UlaG (beta-lactamase superfamily)
VEIVARSLYGSLADELRRPPGKVPRLHWLGQAGFVLRLPAPSGPTILIDPYLSDFLADKYRGRRFDHVRMMPAPIEARDLPPVDLVLCTHRHSDHMDPWTLPVIAECSPACRFVVPGPEADHAVEVGVPANRLVPAAPGFRLELLPGFTVRPIPSAHEALEVDEHGNSRYLGYVLEAGDVRLYHSGDCIPFPGQAGILERLRIDVALLPVNGRDPERSDHGVPGNFTWSEALALCVAAGIPSLIPHHFGMFAFNTVDPWTLPPGPPAISVTVPSVECLYELWGTRRR